VAVRARGCPGDAAHGARRSVIISTVSVERVALNDVGRVDNGNRMWRKDVFATAPADSAPGHRNQVLSPRIADRIYPGLHEERP